MNPAAPTTAGPLDFPPDPKNVCFPTARRSTGFYAPALDGLRCVAVVAVLITHFSPTLAGIAEWGQWGVRLFFVLSGFLITRSLLETRLQTEAGLLTMPSAVRAFFIRRIFRLWPVYFLCLAFVYAFNVESIRATIWWHVLMVSNQYVFHIQSWPGMLSHFWTLAVEQQFYLFWPFLILLTPRRWLSLVIMAGLITGPLARETLLKFQWSNLSTIYTPLPCCLDFFAIGALVAWGHQQGWLDRFATSLRLRLSLVVFGGWLFFGCLLKSAGEKFPDHWAVYDPLIQALGFAALIVYLLRRPTGLAGRFLSLRPLVYIGEISYGLYIFHNFAHRFGPSILRHTLGFAYLPNEFLHVGYYTILSVAVAAASYHLFEEPIRRLGRSLA